jgi:putative hemolysin
MAMSAPEWALAGLMLPLLAASSFFSASETALFGLSADDRVRLRHQNPGPSRVVESLLEDPRQLLVSVLLGNMSVNTLYFVISSMLIARAGFGFAGNIAFGAFTLLFVILGAEVLPKLLADAKRRRAASLLAPAFLIFHRAIAPIRVALDRSIIAPLSRLTAPREGPPILSPAELATMLEQSGRAGVIDADEQRVLRGVFELRRLRVRDVMTPRVDMAWIESNATRAEVIEMVRAHRLTRLPVVGKGIDDIVGILHVKRFLLDRRGDATPLSDYLRRPRFVPEVASVEQMLDEFHRHRSDLALVVDEYGGTAGVVALEDCVEEVVGDIVSPEEIPESPPQEIEPGVWAVTGDTNLQRWAEAFGERYLNSRASTLGGFLLEQLGRPAIPGDVVRLSNLRLTVESTNGHRVRQVMITLEEDRHASARAASIAAGGRDSGHHPEEERT